MWHSLDWGWVDLAQQRRECAGGVEQIRQSMPVSGLVLSRLPCEGPRTLLRFFLFGRVSTEAYPMDR